jgi:hypothetical protein
MNQEIISFLKAALECSVFVDPVDPGLTVEELVEIGKRVGYQQGEIGDALGQVIRQYYGKDKILPDGNTTISWMFLTREEPEYRNFAAFDFVFAELNALVRAEGAARALLQRSVLVERAIANGIDRHDIEVAITYQIMAKMLAEKDGVLRFPNGGVRGLPSEQLNTGHARTTPKPQRARAFPIAKDVIERRADGRPRHAEPFDAFAEELDKLSYGPFRLWWKQTVAELRQNDPIASPVSASVLSAALVEGALTFVVKHARTTGLGLFQSTDYERDPRTWKIDDLVTSAAKGGPSAILDLQTKNRAEILVRSRQRIHAGRMLSEFPGGPPDIRPEEARAAKETAEQVVRAIIDWLQKFPPP